MVRLKIGLLAIVLAADLIFFGGCANLQQGQNTSDVKIWHVVIVRLKNPGNEADRQRLLTASNDLRKIRSVKALFCGKVIPGNRPHVDSNFDIALTVGFASEADMAAYVADPIHVNAVKQTLLPIAQDYTIYDFRNE
jgi:hypothetical protein